MLDSQSFPNQLRTRIAIRFLLCITTTLALVFVFRTEIIWSEMHGVLLLGTLAFVSAAFIHAFATTCFRDAMVLLIAAVTIGAAMEYSSLSWRFPFGAHYRYHPDLPQVFALPWFIPLSWYALSAVPLVFLRSYEVRNRGLSHRVLKSFLCAIVLTSGDLLLDPLAVSFEAWQWKPAGPYYGVPLENFLGWLITGFVIYFVYFSVDSGRLRSGTQHWDDEYALIVFGMTLVAWVAAWVRLSGLQTMFLFWLTTTTPFVIYWWTHRSKDTHARNGQGIRQTANDR